MGVTYRGTRGGYNDRETTTEIRAVIAGLDVPFMDLVAILVKLSLAAIPAMIILAFFGAALFAMIGALGYTLAR